MLRIPSNFVLLVYVEFHIMDVCFLNNTLSKLRKIEMIHLRYLKIYCCQLWKSGLSKTICGQAHWFLLKTLFFWVTNTSFSFEKKWYQEFVGLVKVKLHCACSLI